jgi:hypothetical protein
MGKFDDNLPPNPITRGYNKFIRFNQRKYSSSLICNKVNLSVHRKINKAATLVPIEPPKVNKKLFINHSCYPPIVAIYRKKKWLFTHYYFTYRFCKHIPLLNFIISLKTNQHECI